MFFDTHCHLNFSRFKKNVDEVIDRAKKAGVTHIVIPGTDVETSQKAVEIASQYENIYAAVGIHPHHSNQLSVESVKTVENLLTNPKVVAIGEVGLDRHVYEKTKYENYQITEEFIAMQRKLLNVQIKLAIQYGKSIILHNREAKADMLPMLREIWDSRLEYRTVFHCCEPDVELLEFAKVHNMFIGVDGDITYYPEKQEFIKKVPLEMLVLETDSPYLLPEPLRAQKKFPNEPANIPLIGDFIAKLKGIPDTEIARVSFENSLRLFSLTS